jgi:RNA polymerase sigma-70 factor (ECF subfamily)
VKHFLADRRKAACRGKRGGGIIHRSLDSDSAQQAPDPANAFDETHFDQQWAFALLDRVLTRLEGEFEAAGRIHQFQALKPWLTGLSATDEKQSSSAALGLSPGALNVAVHRLRKRFRALVREEIVETVANDAEVDEELGYLLSVLVNHPMRP